jgi:hypothetical protein
MPAPARRGRCPPPCGCARARVWLRGVSPAILDLRFLSAHRTNSLPSFGCVPSVPRTESSSDGRLQVGEEVVLDADILDSLDAQLMLPKQLAKSFTVDQIDRRSAISAGLTSCLGAKQTRRDKKAFVSAPSHRTPKSRTAPGPTFPL